MNDDTPTPDPATARAAFLAGEASTTWAALFHEGPAVMHALKTNYPGRADELEQAHARWQRAGRPDSMVRTGRPVTEPTPRPVPVETAVNVPDPASVTTMRDLLAAGPVAFHAFQQQHPDAYNRLAASVGMPPLSRP